MEGGHPQEEVSAEGEVHQVEEGTVPGGEREAWLRVAYPCEVEGASLV